MVFGIIPECRSDSSRIQRSASPDSPLSPVLVNLTAKLCTLIAPFEKNSARWPKMPYINIHDGSTRTLQPATLAVLAQTFNLVFSQYYQYPESRAWPRMARPAKATPADADALSRHRFRLPFHRQRD
jgi:hypothetical protein